MKKSILILTTIALAAISSAEYTVVGDDLLNGNFNTTGGTEDFRGLKNWINIGTGGDTQPAVSAAKRCVDSSPAASLSSQADRIHGLDTRYILAADESFSIVYSYCYGNTWEKDDRISVALFTTDNNTITGKRTNLVVDLSDQKPATRNTLMVNHSNIYRTGSADARKKLFVALSVKNGNNKPSDKDFAVLDNFKLTVTQALPTHGKKMKSKTIAATPDSTVTKQPISTTTSSIPLAEALAALIGCGILQSIMLRPKNN